jgi:predicted PurR-regulated permease PerM
MTERMFDFFKEIHDREVSRKLDIENSVSNTASTIVLLFAFLSFYLLNWPDASMIKRSMCLYNVFAILTTIGILLLAVCVAFLIKFYLDGSVYLLSTANKLYEYYNKDIIPYAESNNTNNEEEFFSAIAKQYIEVSTENTKINDRRSEIHYNARRCLFASFVILLLAFMPYFIVMGDELNMSKMEIHKSIDLKIKD